MEDEEEHEKKIEVKPEKDPQMFRLYAEVGRWPDIYLI